MKFSNDRFKSKRGGTSKWLVVSCVDCSQDLFVYQKDGTGNLLRFYLDRIYECPSGERPFKNLIASQIGNLVCKNCGLVIGVPLLYEKNNERRLSERIINPGPNIKTVSQKLVDSMNLDPTAKVELEKGK